MSASISDDPEIPELEIIHNRSHSTSPSAEKMPSILRQLPAVRYDMCVSGHVAQLDSPGMQRARAIYNLEMSHSESSNYSQNYNDKIGIVMIRTSKADEQMVCGYIHIHRALAVMAVYHFVVSIIYMVGLCLSFRGDDGLDAFVVWIYVFLVFCMGLRCLFPITFSILILMTKYKAQSVSEFINHSAHRIVVRLWSALLLIAPILMAFIFLLGFMMSNAYDQFMDLRESEGSAFMVFVAVLIDVMLSVYFFSVAHQFASTKWPHLWQ